MSEFTTVLSVLGATWAGMFPVLKVVEINNSKRDLVLNINKDGERLTVDHRKMLLYCDFVPIWFGILIFLVIYAGAFLALPFIVEQKVTNPKEALVGLEMLGCFGAAGFVLFALTATLVGGIFEIMKMRRFINGISGPKNPWNDDGLDNTKPAETDCESHSGARSLQSTSTLAEKKPR